MAETREVGTGSGGIGTATVAVSGSSNKTAGGVGSIQSPNFHSANSPLSSALITLTGAAFNNIHTLAPIPATATMVKITPPPGNAVTMTLKGVTGDTGVILHPLIGGFFGITAPCTVLGITAGVGGIANLEVEYY